MSIYGRSRALGAVVGAGAFLLLGALAGPLGSAHVATDGLASTSSSTILVDDNHVQCPTALYTTIQAAVAAAPAGSTIKVCPGTYQGPVVITEALTIVGPKGVAQQRNPGDSKHQAIVIGGASGDGFTLGSGSSGTTINGFVVTGGAQPLFDAGINVTDSAGTGYTILNNLIINNNVGMYFHSTGGQVSRIEGNAFENNTAGGFPTPNSGSGIFTQLSTINDTTITGNFFSGQTDSDLNLGASAGGLVITKNQTKNDTTFLVLGNATGAVVSGNTVQAPVQGSAMYIFGGNSSVQITNNHLVASAAEAATGSSGIRLTQNFGATTGNTGMTISGNTITGYDYGIRGADIVSSTLKGNKVGHAGVDGIGFDNTTSGNTLTNNNASKSGTFDCHDTSTGPGTAGTANTWINDDGKKASPPAICD
ncbi:MAG: hypothetical protein M3R48_07160 [Candidatus Dormibacteraeota bacterium]|nr:hypothetical protein [Candidatus Dormibacteraeota bacterium]